MFLVRGSIQRGVSRGSRLTPDKIESAREVKACLMVFLPIQGIYPVIQVFIQPAVQTDVQEE